jgi:hypothetical protein
MLAYLAAATPSVEAGCGCLEERFRRIVVYLSATVLADCY